MKFIGLLTLIIIASLTTKAGAVLTSLDGFYLSKSIQNSDNTTSEQIKTQADLNLSYISSSGLMLGGIYVNDTLDSGSNIEKTSGYGPLLGFLLNPWAIEAVYLTQMEYLPSSSSDVKWTQGSGYQISLSYLGIGKQGLFWGFQWVYRLIEYKQYDDGVTKIEDQRKVSETFPQIKIGYIF